MSQTRLSSKYQVVIPKDIRESTDVRPGQTFQVIAKGGVITLIPERSLASLRGMAKGVSTAGFREKKDRF